MGYELTSEMAKHYSQRGRQANLALYRIEGESVTAREIAQRVGISLGEVSKRISRLRRASGPITWNRLSTGSAA